MPTPNVNTDIINYQTADLLASIVGQATGKVSITPVTASQFVSVATTLKSLSSDIVMNAISNVLSRTIFSIRPYNAKFKGLQKDTARYGSRIRKLTVLDKPFTDDPRYSLTDGNSVDPFIVSKPDVLEVNIYGEIAVEKIVTIFDTQLNTAFSSASEFEQFIAMVMTNVSDMLEQERETVARNTVCNLIAGTVAQASASIGTERVIYLVDEYNTATDQELTADDLKSPTYFPAFARWLFGYLKTLSDRMTNRSKLYHQNFVVNDVERTVMRHTPIEKQKCYLYSPLLNDVSANVLSTVFYDRYLQLMDHEAVDFWQSINTGMTIKSTPVYTDADGDAVNAGSAVTINNVLGVIFDEDAAGIYFKDQRTAAAYNPRGAYTNQIFNENVVYWNDFSENCVVLLLDSAE